MSVNRRFSMKLLTVTGFLTIASLVFSTFSGLVNGSARADVMNLSPGENVMGLPDAPVTIIEYSSMTCPLCADFHNDVFPTIKKQYIDTGKAKLVIREFPVSTRDVRSIAAFMLARCAGKDRYFPMVNALFKKQSEWAYAENPVPVLLNIAKLAGFTRESFDACLKDQEQMDSILAIRNSAANNYDISGTPTFFINGKKQIGNTSIEKFSELIEEAL